MVVVDVEVNSIVNYDNYWDEIVLAVVIDIVVVVDCNYYSFVVDDIVVPVAVVVDTAVVVDISNTNCCDSGYPDYYTHS